MTLNQKMFPALSFRKDLHENENKFPLSTLLAQKANKILNEATLDDHYPRFPTNSTDTPYIFPNPRIFAYSSPGYCNTIWLQHKNQPPIVSCRN
jgi:hypothetical protein